MKKVERITKRLLAIMLAGVLAIGPMAVSVSASENKEAGPEIVVKEMSEDVTADAMDAEAGATEESAAVDVDDDTVVEDGTTATPAGTETVDATDEVASYTVTLDANGGYFENEWDDVLGGYIERTEILNKVIIAGESILAQPLHDETDSTWTFLGWSLEQAGEIINYEDNNYIPVGDCTLYAVWGEEQALEANDDNLDDSAPESNVIDSNTTSNDVNEESKDIVNDHSDEEKTNAHFETGEADEVSTIEEDLIQQSPSEEAIDTQASYANTLGLGVTYHSQEEDRRAHV